MRLDTRFARLLVVIVLLALPLSATAAQPLFVGNGTPASCTEAALQNALAVAGTLGGGTIKFKCGTDPVTIVLSEAGGEIPGFGSVALIPPNNTTIDGGGAVTILGLGSFNGTLILVDRDTAVVLKNLSIINGNPRFLLINEGTLIIKQSAVSSVFGGIRNTGTLTVMDSTVFDTGRFVGDPIFNGGTLTVKNSVFSGNGGGSTGGISNSGTATVESSRFLSNGAEGCGAIVNAGTLIVENSEFSDNRGIFGVGGICNQGSLSVKNTTFFENSAHQGAAGGIGNSGTLTVQNSVFSGNRTGGGGGGIGNSGTLTIQNSEFSGNSAGFGGGIANSGTLAVYNSSITQNTASQDGGGIYTCCGGTLELENTVVTGNTPNDIVP